MGRQAKYLTVRAEILSDLRARLTPGDMLATERELAEQFDVSRMTVRQALNSLRDDGVIRSVRGVGTFVATPRVSKAPALTSFSEDLAARGYLPTTSVISAELTTADTESAIDLGIAPGSRVYFVERLRLADGIPMCHEIVRLPASRFPGLLDRDLSTSLYGILEADYDTRLRRAKQNVRAINIGPESAAVLDVAPGTAALHVRRISIDDGGRVVERGEAICRGDLYDYSFVVTRPGSE